MDYEVEKSWYKCADGLPAAGVLCVITFPLGVDVTATLSAGHSALAYYRSAERRWVYSDAPSTVRFDPCYWIPLDDLIDGRKADKRSTTMSKVEIDGVDYEVPPQVAGLLQAVSEERDAAVIRADNTTADEVVVYFSRLCRDAAIAGNSNEAMRCAQIGNEVEAALTEYRKNA